MFVQEIYDCLQSLREGEPPRAARMPDAAVGWHDLLRRAQAPLPSRSAIRAGPAPLAWLDAHRIAQRLRAVAGVGDQPVQAREGRPRRRDPKAPKTRA